MNVAKIYLQLLKENLDGYKITKILLYFYKSICIH